MLILCPTGYLHVGLSETTFQSKYYCISKEKANAGGHHFNFPTAEKLHLQNASLSLLVPISISYILSILPVKLLNEIWGCKKKGEGTKITASSICQKNILDSIYFWRQLLQ